MMVSNCRKKKKGGEGERERERERERDLYSKTLNGTLKKKKKKLRRRKNYPYKKQTLIGDGLRDDDALLRQRGEEKTRDATRKDDLFFDRVETSVVIIIEAFERGTTHARSFK